MRFVILDSNVWVSALAFRGEVPNRILNLVKARYIRSATSEPLIDQVVRALIRLQTSPSRVQTAEIVMKQTSRIVQPSIRFDIISDKESDNRVLECAVTGEVDAIVTGDRKHLLPLRGYAGIPILSPSEFLAALQRSIG